MAHLLVIIGTKRSSGQANMRKMPGNNLLLEEEEKNNPARLNEDENSLTFSVSVTDDKIAFTYNFFSSMTNPLQLLFLACTYCNVP